MKHSAQIKYPVNFLIAAVSIMLICLVVVGIFVYNNNSRSLEEKENSNTGVVEQLDRQSFNQALDYISKSNK